MNDMEYKEAVNNYFIQLKNRVYKILPIYENGIERVHLFKHIQTLLFEFDGLPYFMDDFKKSSEFIVLYATLESLADESLFDDDNHEIVRREVFKCLNILSRFTESSDGDLQ